MFEETESAARTLVMGGIVFGKRHSAGPWTTAVPSEHRWAVIDLQGMPVILAHDAFEVALAFVKAESGDVPGDPLALETDAVLSARATEERRADPRNLWYSMVIDGRRATAAGAQTP